jgi:nuclease HARBI1
MKPFHGMTVCSHNGHNFFYAPKFQAVMLPNSMFGHPFGPEEGHHNDNHLLAKSSFLDLCAQHAICPGTNDDDPLHIQYLQIFGDPADRVNNHIISLYAGAGEQTEEEKE